MESVEQPMTDLPEDSILSLTNGMSRGYFTAVTKFPLLL
jgi:hypothetical protein